MLSIAENTISEEDLGSFTTKGWLGSGQRWAADRLESAHSVAYIAFMRRHNITLSEPVSEMVRAQVNYFFGPPSAFEEYGVTPEEADQTAQRDLAATRKVRNAGKLKPGKPRR